MGLKLSDGEPEQNIISSDDRGKCGKVCCRRGDRYPAAYRSNEPPCDVFACYCNEINDAGNVCTSPSRMSWNFQA